MLWLWLVQYRMSCDNCDKTTSNLGGYDVDAYIAFVYIDLVYDLGEVVRVLCAI